MNAYIDTFKVTDENGEKSILYPTTKQEAVEGLGERLTKLEVVDIAETEDTTLENSNAGRLLFTEIKGAMEQGANPSPTNPQEIRNVAISGIKTHGKNLVELSTEGMNSATYSNGVYTSSALSDYGLFVINLKETKQFKQGEVAYISMKLRRKSGTGANLNYFSLRDSVSGKLPTISEKKNHSLSDDFVVVSCKMTFEEDIEVNTAIFQAGGNVTNLILEAKDIMVSYDTNFDAYEPYTESSITFSQPIELYGLDDVRDILTSKQIKRKFGVKVLNGSEDWTCKWQVENLYVFSMPPYSDFIYRGSSAVNYLCSHFRAIRVNDRYQDNTVFANIVKYFTFTSSSITTLEEWKAHLASNPITVVYELAEETTEELPIADQIALNSLLTFDGITYIEFISEIQPTFSAKYGTTEMGGMTLESLLTARSNDLRLSAVESAVINNI